jgi:hypothetical protein
MAREEEKGNDTEKTFWIVWIKKVIVYVTIQVPTPDSGMA